MSQVTKPLMTDETGKKIAEALKQLESITGIQGPQGPKGDTGDTGPQGQKGEKGDKGDKGDTGATGATGAAGADGVSPTVTTEAITGGTKVNITDKDGVHEFNVMNGVDGAKGDKGDKGDMPPIAQTTGDSETSVMSQNAVTVEVNALKSDITDLQTALIGVSDLIGGDA